MRVFIPLVIVALLVVVGYVLPVTSQQTVVYFSCYVPSELAGEDVGPLVERDDVSCEIGEETRITKSRYFGIMAETTSSRSVIMEGPVLEIGAPLFAGETDFTPAQTLACLQILPIRI